ncbi:MAG: adenosylcobinamide-GDP ribazoletransferase [Nitrospinota bacterium]|nr:adenosylcobinamide-GDP ribazoletransferase [Nitrospinota bacterium]
MTSLIKLCSCAFRSFTLSAIEDTETQKCAQSTAIFPVVAMMVGAVLSVFHKMMTFAVPEDVADFLVIISLAAFAQGRHLTGFAGFLARFSKSKPENYFKANQGFLIILSQLIKYYALVQTPSAMKTGIIFLMPMVSSWVMVQLCFLVGLFLKPTGRQGNFTYFVTWKELMIATGFTLTLLAPFLELKGLGIVIIMALFSFIFITAFQDQSREFNGNALGASNELSQALFLISIRLLYGEY